MSVALCLYLTPCPCLHPCPSRVFSPCLHPSSLPLVLVSTSLSDLNSFNPSRLSPVRSLSLGFRPRLFTVVYFCLSVPVPFCFLFTPVSVSLCPCLYLFSPSSVSLSSVPVTLPLCFSSQSLVLCETLRPSVNPRYPCHSWDGSATPVLYSTLDESGSRTSLGNERPHRRDTAGEG